MGDGPRYPTISNQPCIPPWSLNRRPVLLGHDKGGNVASAGRQVILCDPVAIWHVSFRSDEACCELYPVTLVNFALPRALVLGTQLPGVNILGS